MKNNGNEVVKTFLHALYGHLKHTPPKRIPAPKRASVAAVFRIVDKEEKLNAIRKFERKRYHVDSSNEGLNGFLAGKGNIGLELMYIRRVHNPKDRWSGQVAFPGGRQQDNESDLETAKRECLEETGLDLCQEGILELGRIPDRVVGVRSKFVVSTFVFLQDSHVSFEPKLQENEVADILWVDFENLLSMNPRSVVLELQTHELLASTLRNHHLKRILRPLGLDVMIFPCIHLEKSTTIDGRIQYTRNSTEFILWGLTFGMTSDIIQAAGYPSLRWNPPFKFRNPAFTVFLHAYFEPWKSVAYTTGLSVCVAAIYFGSFL